MANVARVLHSHGFADDLDGDFVRLRRGKPMNYERFKAAVLMVSSTGSFQDLRHMYGYRAVVREKRNWYEIRKFKMGEEEEGFTF